MKKYLYFLPSLVALAISSSAFSLTMVQPFPYVSASQTGRFYCKIIPTSNTPDFWHKAQASVYALTVSGKEKLLWSVNCPYSRRIFLSYNGEILAVVATQYYNNGPDKDLLIAFYRKGRLVKQYTIQQLIRYPALLRASRFQNNYVKEIHGFMIWTNRFILVTGDGTRYTFDTSTGRILSKK